MERLYIDGMLMDLGKDTNISLAIVSNLFSDVSKMSGNSSYTIKLPRTARNSAALSYADKVDVLDSGVYKRHKAHYIRNGVEIISNGEASVMGATADGYEVVIVFGCRAVLSSLVDRNPSLKDLSSDVVLPFSLTPTRSHYNSFVSQGYGYVMMETIYAGDPPTEWHGQNAFGVWSGSDVEMSPMSGGGGVNTGEMDTNKPMRVIWSGDYNHPCVRVGWILTQIANDWGVTFSWSGDAAATIGKMIVPCVSKDANSLTYDGGGLVGVFTAAPSGYNQKATMAVTCDNNIFGNIHSSVQQLTVLTDCSLMVSANVTIKHEWEDIFNSIIGQPSGDEVQYLPRQNMPATDLEIVVKHTNNSEDTYRIGNAQRFFVGNLFSQHIGFVESLKSQGVIDVEAGDVVSVVLKGIGYRSFHGMTMTGGLSAMAVDGNDVPFGGYFPIVANLPDIKVLDLVKFLCAVTGTFPCQHSSADGIVEFVPYDSLLDNIERAKDWTRRLIADADRNTPRKVSYKLDGWARRNAYRWKADDRTFGEYDGTLDIYDETLDEERDVITFPFAASDQALAGVASVPLYERKLKYDDDGVLIEDEYDYEYSKCEPRVLMANGEGESQVSTKFGLNMQSILADRYKLLTDCLNDARIVEEEIRLTDAELKEFDETIPIWLGQYGCYFAVLEIKAGNDGVCSVKMIKIGQEEEEDVPTPTTLTITTSLENVTSNAPASVESGASLSVVLSGTGSNKVQANSVVVLMGGVDVTSSTYNHTSKTITIASVTGNVSITAIGRPYDAEVEWLGSSGTQYIDLGVAIVSSTDAIDIDFMLTESEAANRGVFGARSGASNRNFSVAVGSSDNVIVDVNNGTYATYRIDAAQSGYNKRIFVHAERANKAIKYDGVQVVSSATSSQSFTTSVVAHLFKVNGINALSAVRVYSLQWERSGSLLFDMIPVRNNGVGYLYDKVSGQLFGNSGSGTFTYGNDK